VKRILLLIALLGIGTSAYVLLRPVQNQVVRLEAITPLPSQLDQPAPSVQASNRPVLSIKPRPTKPIEPRRTPIIKTPTRETQKPVTTRDVEKPVATRETQNPVTTQEIEKPVTRDPEKPTTPEIPPSTPNLTVRQDAGAWRVQAGAFRTPSNAAALQTKIAASGLSALVTKGEDGIYRVLVGNYSTSGAARADSNKVSSAIR
jgi:cell division protein FtsN